MMKIGFVSLQLLSCIIDIVLWSNFGYATNDVRVGSCYSNALYGYSSINSVMWCMDPQSI